MAKCLECGGEFEAKRSTAKFCNANCRLSFHRKNETLTNVTLKPEKIIEKIEEVKSKIQAEKILEKQVVTKHTRGTENLELQETCQKLVNEGKLDPCHIDLADWGFVDPNPGAESYFFPKKFKSHGVAQIKAGRK